MEPRERAMTMDITNPNSTSVFDLLRLRTMSPEWIVVNESPETTSGTKQMINALKTHWPEYSMEALELALFMIAACAFGVLLFHPSSPLVQLIPGTAVRRVLMGIAMGSTAVAIIFSPFGKRSGAHFNPTVTLTYLRLGKIKSWDALFYILFQFAGGIGGVLAATLLLGRSIAEASVNFVVTIPGPAGPLPAFLAELTITFILMTVVLNVSNTKRLARWTGLFAGVLVAVYISIEAPISGMSMNPARTLGSAIGAHLFTSLWIYFTAPPLGMFLAAEIYQRLNGGRVACAKLHHHNNQRCIFNCNFEA